MTLFSQDVEDRTIGQLVHQSLLPAVQLHLFPKSSIDIFIEIIENDGLEGCVASASIAASAALVDAGIEMQGMVVACCAVSILLPSIRAHSDEF
jgi:exosome complex component MTR3